MQPLRFSFGNHTDVGLVRQANEDYYGTWAVGGGQLFVVCDGMGGHAGGAEASQVAVGAIHDFFSGAGADFNPVIALHQALEAANAAVLQRKAEVPSLAQMGTTAVVVFIREGKLWYAHVGDSRIYHSTATGLHQLTRDHSFVQLLVDSGELRPEEAARHPRRNEITRAIGIAPVLEPAVCAEPLVPAPGDCVLLCTDGLTGMVADSNIQAVLRAGEQGLQEKAFTLIHLANEAGGTDNSTVQIICFGEEAERAAPAPVPGRSARIGLILVLPVMALAGWFGYRMLNRSGGTIPGRDTAQAQLPATGADSGASIPGTAPAADTAARPRIVSGAEEIPIAVPVRGERRQQGADSGAGLRRRNGSADTTSIPNRP